MTFMHNESPNKSQSETHQRTPRALATGLLMLASMLLVPGSALADEPALPKPLVREIFVPFEDLNILLEGQTQRIFLKRAEYEELLAKAKTSIVENAPRAVTVLAAEYLGQVDEGRMTIAGNLTMDVLADGLHAVPLELAGVGVRTALLDGQPAALGINEQRQPVLFVEGKGRKTLKLELVAALETSTALQSLNFQIPVPASTSFKLTVPGNVELRSGGDVSRRELDADNKATKFELLPKRGPNTLVMTLNNRQLLKERVVVASSVLVDEVTQAYERLHATISLGVLHGAVDRFRFEVPEGFEVTDVRTPLLSRWVVEKKADQKPILDVTLREPTTDTVLLNLEAVRTGANMDEWAMPRFEPLDVAGHVSVIGLLVEDQLKLDDLTPTNLIPVNTEVLTRAMPESVFHAEPGAPQIRPVAAFYAPQAGFQLQARFRRPPSKLSVTTNVLLILGDGQQQVRGAFAVLPEREKQFAIDFAFPAGWHITQVNAADGSALPFEVFAENQNSRVLVRLPAGIPPGVQTNVFFQATSVPEGWLGDWTQTEVTFPRFVLANTDRDEGAIAVVATDDLRVRPDKLDQLVPLDEAEKGKYGLGGVPTDLVYLYETQPYAASFVIERATPTISARTYSFFRVEAESLVAHYEIVYDVQDARTRRLSFQLPRGTPTALSVRGLDGVVVKEFNSDEGAPDAPAKDGASSLRRWNVLLGDRARDRIRLAVDFVQPLTEKDWKKTGLPIVAADGVTYQSGAWAVEGGAELDVETDVDSDAPGNARSIDVGELAAADYQVGRRLLGSWGFVGQVPDVSVRISRRPGYGLPSAIVQRAELLTLVATHGLSQVAARFQLRTKANYLEVRLPAGARLWSVFLDRQPVAPQRDGDAVILSLPVSQTETLRDLQVVYELPSHAFLVRGTVEAPAPKLFLRDEQEGERVEVPVADLVWHLRLPSGYKVADSSGTVYPDFSDPQTQQQLALRESPWKQLAVASVAMTFEAARGVKSDLAFRTASPTASFMAGETSDLAMDPRPEHFMAPKYEPQDHLSATLDGRPQDSAAPLGDMSFAIPPPGESGSAAPAKRPSSNNRSRLNAERDSESGYAYRFSRGGMPGMPARPNAGPSGAGAGLAMPGMAPGTPAGPGGGGPGGGGQGGPGAPGASAPFQGTGATAGAGSRAPEGAEFSKENRRSLNEIDEAVDADRNAQSEESFSQLRDFDDTRSLKSSVYWALEGVKSLPFDFGPYMSRTHSDVISFHSLGVDPVLRATLVNNARLRAIAWCAALSVLLAGLILIGRPAGVRVKFLAIILFVATVAPLLAPWMFEIGTIADFVFWAAIALVPVYLLTAVIGGVRWLIRRERSSTQRPAPTPTSTPPSSGTVAVASAAPTAVLVLLSLILGPSAVQAQAPATPDVNVTVPLVSGEAGQILIPLIERLKPVRVPEEAVIIPYNPADDEGIKNAEKLLVPYAKYVELWNLAYPDKKKSATPLAALFAWAGANYEATLAGDAYLVVTGKLQVELYSDDAVDVPLPLIGGVLAEAKVDGQPARIRLLQAQPDAAAQSPAQAAPNPAAGQPTLLALTLSGKGRKQLQLTVRMRLERRGGWRVAEGQLPTAPATSLTLRIPEAKMEVRLSGVRDRVRYESTAPNERIDTALTTGEPFSLQWRPKVAEGEVDKSLTANSLAEFDVREDALRLTWRVTLDFPRSRRESFTLQTPAEYLVERVAGPNVRGWQATPDGQNQKIEVTLLKTASDKESLVVYLSRRGRVGYEMLRGVALPAVTIADAVLHQGTIVIRRSPQLDVRVDAMSGLTRTDAPADMIDPQHAAADQSLLGLQLFQAFRFPTATYNARLEVSPIPSSTTAEVQSLLRITDRDRELESRVLIKPSGTPVFAIHVRIPAELKLVDVTAPSPNEWSVTSGDEKGAPQLLSVFLSNGQMQPYSVVLRGKLGERKATEVVSLPVIDVQGVKSQEGDVVVQVDPAVDVRADDLRNCESVLLNRVHGWLASEQRTTARLAFHYRSPAYSGTLRLTFRQPKVSCYTVTNIKLTGRTIEETITLNFQITDAGIRQLSFQVPDWLRNARVKSQLLRRKLVSEPDANGLVRITLELQDEVIGPFQVLVESDRLLTRENQRVPVPADIQVLPKTDVRVDQRLVALESSGRDEVVFDDQEGVEALTRQQKQWQKLTELFGTNLLAGYAVQASAPTPRLTYHLKDRASVVTVGARIGLADTVLIVDGSGAFRAKQSYQVDNTIEQFLVVELPENATLWTALVAGEPVKPTAAPGGPARQVRIPLVKTAPGDLDYPVVLTYGGQLSNKPGAIAQVKFPLMRTININVELSHVRLLLPHTHRWFNFGGSMGQVDDRGEFQAGALEYQSKKIQQLSQLLSTEGTDELSRLRAGNNLKQLGNAFRAHGGSGGGGGQLGGQFYFDNGLDFSGNENVRKSLGALQQAQEQAQRQVEGEELKARQLMEADGLAIDNRARLNDMFDKQQANRAKNVVSKLGRNFDATEPEQTVQKDSNINPGWFEQNKLQNDAAKLSGKSGARFQPGYNPMDTTPGQPQAGKPMQVELKAAELSQFKGGKGQASVESLAEDRQTAARGSRRGKDDSKEVQERYQQRLQSQSVQTLNNPAAAPQTATPNVMSVESAPQPSLPQRSDAPQATNGAIANPAPNFAPQAPSSSFDSGGVYATHLASLDVELPERGTEYLFRTPRGEIEITANAVTTPLVDRSLRLVIVAIVVAFLWAATRIVTSARKSRPTAAPITAGAA